MLNNEELTKRASHSIQRLLHMHLTQMNKQQLAKQIKNVKQAGNNKLH